MYKAISKFLLTAVIAIGTAYWGCQSLSTQNVNNPDTERALGTPGDVEALIGGSMLSWFRIHNQWGVEHLSVTADALSCSWGNYSMKDMSSEPRSAFNNSTSYTYINAIQLPWTRCYQAISAVHDGLQQLDAGLDLGDATKNHRARAFAKLVQGLAHGYLACFYDRAFVLDETIDINTDVLELQPYQAVMAAAIQQLEEAASLLETGPAFTTDDGWINGVNLTNDELAGIAHSYIARYLAQVARNPEERAAVDWNKVKANAEKGVTEAFAPHGDGSFGGWFHSNQWFHNDRGASWARLDYKMIGGSDKSDGYQNWLNTPVQLRKEFAMDTDDKRLSGMTIKDFQGNDTDGGIYAGNFGPTPFPAIRGTYHFSLYGYYRYEELANGGIVAPSPIFLPAENDFLIAEALLWTGGSVDEIGALIDKTRVTNGGYPPAASVTSGIGDVRDARSPLDGSSLWAMLKYDKQLECLQTGAGLEYFDNRGWGDLVTDTPIHWPIPAQELETLQQQIYTFGGGGDGSAPKVNVKPGPPE
ncbi:MAG: hypothetical protein ACE5G1_00180 [bacterium]